MARRHSPMDEKLLRSRHSGYKGGVIPLHHSFTRLRFGASAKLSLLLLPLLFDFLLLISMDSILAFWGNQFGFWVGKLELAGRVGYEQTSLLGYHTLMIPYLDIPAALPSSSAVWINLVAVVVLFILTYLLPSAMTPIIYLIRAALIIQSTASAYLFFYPGSFPHDIAHYTTVELTLAVYTLLVLPLLLGMTYYIFDFALWRKCVMTSLILLFFIIAVPFQYMLHAYIFAAGSLMFMPVMYLLFGTLLDIVMFIAMYAFAMSWQGAKKDESGKFA